MTLTKYNRSEVTVSDHRPVFAHFKVKVNKVIDTEFFELEDGC